MGFARKRRKKIKRGVMGLNGSNRENRGRGLHLRRRKIREGDGISAIGEKRERR